MDADFSWWEWEGMRHAPNTVWDSNKAPHWALKPFWTVCAVVLPTKHPRMDADFTTHSYRVISDRDVQGTGKLEIAPLLRKGLDKDIS